MSGNLKQSLIGLFDPITKALRGFIDLAGNEVGAMPYALAQTAVPVVLPSSGSSNASGQITHTTALPYQPSGVVYIYLPAGVVTAGSAGTAAGLYPAIYSSQTVCQIQGTGIVTANGAYTQTTGVDLTLATAMVPGGAMGANGALRTVPLFSTPSTATTKTMNLKFGGAGAWSNAAATTLSHSTLNVIRNRGAQNSQVSFSATTVAGVGASGGATNTIAIDTSANQPLTFTGQLATATDYIILEGYTVEVLPGA